MSAPRRYPPLTSKLPRFLHGGDYNPDQWPPEVWDQDLRLMRLSHCNAMTIGIFAWVKLEPSEGQFEFDWLDSIMDKLAEHGAVAVLATPSAARPAWMSAKYPEVLRVNSDRRRILHSARHNHCPSSPVYREKVGIINRLLAKRYADHPALALWHLSNEYGGECHCELCQAAFRSWLQQRYGSLEALNQAWWTAFWSHTFTAWSQIESPAPHGENSVHGLSLDWRRFTTDHCVDFMRHEIEPLRELTPDIPVTTNFMGTYPGLNYWKFAEHLDVISWDNYPGWHGRQEDWRLASQIGFVHDLNRCLKGGRPFMLMESTPSTTNWAQVCKLKRPGMHRLSSLQAVAHGSDTVQYFQWRKSRGSSEKLHGAVVDHVGHEHTRVFRDVAELGQVLSQLDPVLGTTVRPDVALIYDWENNWAMSQAQGPRKEKGYLPTCHEHYRPFWLQGVPVDVIDMDQPLESYKLVVAPMLYLLRPGTAERIAAFVRAGGTFVSTYWTGIVNESDLCFLTGWPGPLREVLGIWSEEIDSLWDGQTNEIRPTGSELGLTGTYTARELCDLCHAETAEVLATYTTDFYAGQPALTVNQYGEGRAYHIAARLDERFQNDFYGALMLELGLRRALDVELPLEVTAQVRSDGEKDYVFLLNFADDKRVVDLLGQRLTDLLSGHEVHGKLGLEGYGVRILVRG